LCLFSSFHNELPNGFALAAWGGIRFGLGAEKIQSQEKAKKRAAYPKSAARIVGQILTNALY
jgi:hypothetical protein